MEDIIASVEPQQTVISRSGSTAAPWVRSNFSGDGIAQGLRAPRDGVLIDVRCNCVLCGALDFGGSREIGKALRKIYGAVTQREARHFADHRFREALCFGGKLRTSGRVLFEGGRDSFGIPIETAIDIRVARHDLHVLARFGERNRVNEFSGLAIILAVRPQFDDDLPRRCKRLAADSRAAKLLFQVRDIDRSEPHIVIRINELRARIADFLLLRQAAGGV